MQPLFVRAALADAADFARLRWRRALPRRILRVNTSPHGSMPAAACMSMRWQDTSATGT
jgi:hypothetical protein